MRRRWVLGAAAVTGSASLGLIVLAWAGARDGYGWMSARCGRLPDVHPELGWLVLVLAPAVLAFLASGLALLLETRLKPGARLSLALALVCAVGAACAALISGSACPAGL